MEVARTPLSPAQLQAYERRGFVDVGRLFTDGEISQHRAVKSYFPPLRRVCRLQTADCSFALIGAPI